MEKKSLKTLKLDKIKIANLAEKKTIRGGGSHTIPIESLPCDEANTFHSNCCE